MPKLRTFALQYYSSYIDYDLYNDYYEYDLVINTTFVEGLLARTPKLRTVLFCELNKGLDSLFDRTLVNSVRNYRRGS